MTKFLLKLAELGFIPDNFIKIAVRFITNKRLNESDIHENKFNIIKSISEGGIAEKLMMPMSNIMKFHLHSSSML